MATDIVGLTLEGDDVTVAQLATALSGLAELVSELTKEAGQVGMVDWVIETLSKGSAIATARGTPRAGSSRREVEYIVRSYEEISRNVQSGIFYGISESVLEPILRISSVVGEGVKAAKLSSNGDTFDISMAIKHTKLKIAPPPMTIPLTSYGSVRGRMQSISDRNGLYFMLYDLIYDNAIRCSVNDDKILRKHWGKLVEVEGTVHRTAKGEPLKITDISAIRPIKEMKPGSWRNALGCVKQKKGSDSAAEIIRKWRNG